MTTRADIVRVARSYAGTPFHHRGRLPGVGIDCAGVWICAARELGLVAPDFDVPAYTPSPDGRSLLEWCNHYMGSKVSQSAMQAGDGIVLIVDKHPQHLGVLYDHPNGGLGIVHAAVVADPPRVIETRLMFSRAMRFVAAYAFPGIA